MTPPRGLLVALSEKEWREFLPSPHRERLLALPLARTEVDPLPLLSQPEAWRDLLWQVRPEVLVSCWKTPPLPAELPPELKYVCHFTGTVRKLMTRSHIERGLLVTNWGGAISRVVAECALLLILCALRRASYWTRAMHDRAAWKDDRTYFESLFERRVGLHGFGAISRCLVDLLKPFGVPIATYSPSVPDAELAAAGVRRAHTLDELFANSDVLVELAPLTAKTRGLVDERLLRLLPEGATFVNVGRGAVVDEAALARLAAEGRLHVALDVYDTEPLPADSPFRALANVMMLPHLGGPTVDRRRDCAALGLDNLEAYLAGRPLQAVLTPEIYDRIT